VRQGDALSPKLFTLALENILKTLSWEAKGINVNGTPLNHLRFADEFVLISSDILKRDELKDMLSQTE